MTWWKIRFTVIWRKQLKKERLALNIRKRLSSAKPAEWADHWKKKRRALSTTARTFRCSVPVGALKMTDMKLTDQMSRHEIDGHENDGHENAGHVSGVWIGLHGIDFDLAVLPSKRLLLRFQECSRSKSKLKTIRLYSDDHCVYHPCPSQSQR